MDTSKKYYLAIDVGTTNWKVSIYDEKGNQQDIERHPTISHTDENGYGYYNPNEIWDNFKTLIKTVMKRTPCTISAVSIASIAEAVVPVDRDGNILDNIITWYDTRSIREAEYMKETIGVEKLFSITGLDVNPIFSLPKIMWMRAHKPKVFDKAYKWLQMSDFIIFKLTGEMVTDYTLACRTLAFDVSLNTWSDEILSKLDLSRDIFPTVCESGTVVGTIKRSLCEELGILNAPKVAVGGHDHPVASIVSGAIKEKKVLDSSGTAEAYLFISDKGMKPHMEFKGQRTCRYLEKDRYVLWGGIIASGRSFDWAYSLFTSSKAFGIKQEKYGYETILSQLGDVKGIENGLFYYPHLRGAGAPYWNPKISGSFLGVRDFMDNRCFMRAVIEGLCMQSRMIIEMQEQLSNSEIKNICVVGGSSKNRFWQQMKANITQKNVELCFESEATSLGAAMLAAIGDGTYKDIEEASDFVTVHNEVVTPDEKLSGYYDMYYELYKEGYDKLEQFNTKIYDYVNR